MRIGIMLRAYDRPGGIGIYSRNIVRHLVELDEANHYVLFHNSPSHIGTYGRREHVDEVLIPPSNQLAWDQWYTARAARKWDVDLLFNTKFSVPLWTKAKRIMVLHGASWYVHPELYTKLDIFYVRAAMPLYCRAADFLISNSDLTTNDFKRILGVPERKIETVCLAAGDEFKPIVDALELDRVRERYALPETFILTVSSYDPRKNFGTLLKALEHCRKEIDAQLVVVGKDCQRYREDYGTADRGLDGALHFPGWVEQGDLPAIYSLASAFGFPSVYEEFGIPVVEAMACGCPVVSSNTGAIPELTNGAGLLCDPFDDRALADNLLKVLARPEVAEECARQGLERARDFSWDRAARETLSIFERVMRAEA